MAFVRDNSPDSAHTQEECITPGHGHQDAGTLLATSEAALGLPSESSFLFHES